MAKGKKDSGKHYVSKGERPNVSRKILNAMRRTARENPPIESVIKKMQFRQRVLNNPKGDIERSLRDRYRKEEEVELNAIKLYDQYSIVGLTWGAAVQAAKTNFTEQLHIKWGPRLKAYKDAQEKEQKVIR